MKRNSFKLAALATLVLISVTPVNGSDRIPRSCSGDVLRTLFAADGEAIQGAVLWTTSNDVTYYDLPNAEKQSPLGRFPFGEPLIPQRMVKGPVKDWIEIDWSKSPVWLDATDPYLLCRPQPLKDEQSGLLQKMIVRVHGEGDAQRPEQAVVRAYEKPKSDAPQNSTDISIFDYFFVYAWSGPEWCLLGRHPSLGSQEGSSGLIGWVSKDDLIVWNSRQVLRPKRQARFFESPRAERMLVETTGHWRDQQRRPPLVRRKGDWYQTAVPLDPERDLAFSSDRQVIMQSQRVLKRPLVIFLVDSTESMASYAEQVRDLSLKLVNEQVARARELEVDIQFAVYGYTDRTYGPDHTKVFMPATQSAQQVQQAFADWARMTRSVKGPRGDDLYEDIYEGIRRVIDEELPGQDANPRSEVLPVLIVIGDQGAGYGKEGLQPLYRDAFQKMVPLFIYAGDPVDSGEGDVSFRETAERLVDAAKLSGQSPADDGGHYHRVGPTAAESIGKRLEDILDEVLAAQERADKPTMSLSLGNNWETARAAGDWPLSYSNAFYRLLVRQGYSEEALARGYVIGVVDAWVHKEDVTREVFVKKREVEGWAEFFKRFRADQLRARKDVEAALKHYIEGFTGDPSGQDSLHAVLKKMAHIEVASEMLGYVTMADLEAGVSADDWANIAEALSDYGRAFDCMLSGNAPKYSEVRHVDGDPRKPARTIECSENGRVHWFEFSMGEAAAYLEIDWLP